jgi:hypothetical protein
MHGVQNSGLDPTIDHMPADSFREQLRPIDHAVLPGGQS